MKNKIAVGVLLALFALANIQSAQEATSLVLSSNKDIPIQGCTSWSIDNRKVQMSIGGITNPYGTRTGPLVLELWLSAEPFTNTVAGAIRVAKRSVKRIASLDALGPLDLVARHRHPKVQGEYYSALVLREKSRGKWRIVSMVAFPERVAVWSGGVTE